MRKAALSSKETEKGNVLRGIDYGISTNVSSPFPSWLDIESNCLATA